MRIITEKDNKKCEKYEFFSDEEHRQKAKRLKEGWGNWHLVLRARELVFEPRGGERYPLLLDFQFNYAKGIIKIIAHLHYKDWMIRNDDMRDFLRAIDDLLPNGLENQSFDNFDISTNIETYVKPMIAMYDAELTTLTEDEANKIIEDLKNYKY